MTVDVLGPLVVSDTSLRPRERTVLAALAVHRGGLVAADDLAEACWGEHRPATWWQQIKTSVARIRRALGEGAVRTVPGGYALGLDPALLDAVRFERLVTAAREAAVRGEPERAADAFERALAMWRGPAFPELPDWESAGIERARLAEVRASAQEECLDARLAVGEASPLIPAAGLLVREQPLREKRWAILALANYRSHRQAEALEVLREARARFSDELGIDLGPRLAALETSMLRQDPGLLVAVGPTRASDDCPYQGLRAFDAESADRFFGRDEEIVTLLARVGPGRITAIVGPSGSGKSSLLLAGLVPVLERGGRRVTPLRLDASMPTVVRDLLRNGTPHVMVLDQFESVLRAGDEVVTRLCAGLDTWLDRGGSVVVTLRSDFLDAATALSRIGGRLGRDVFALGSLDAVRLREAIERPAREAGIRLESGLVDVILRDAGNRPATLPLLSHALVETWLRREGNTLTIHGYEDAGGITSAIARSAEDCYRSFTADEADACRSILLRLLDRTPDGAVLRRSVPLKQLLGDPDRRRIAERLVATRLLAIDGETIFVAHEAVARAWPRLEGWLEDDAESAALLRRLESAAQIWDADGRRDEDLLRGARLVATQRWRASTTPALTRTEIDFLAAAERLDRDAIAELEHRARRDRRQNRSLRVSLVAAAALLVGTLAAGSLAVVRSSDAERSAADARIEALVATSRSLVASDRDTAALLAAELYRRDADDPRVRSALLAAVTRAGTPTTKVAFPADERIMATAIPGTVNALVARDSTEVSADDDGTRLQIWNLLSGELVRELPQRLPDARTQFPGSIHIDPTGTFAIVQYPDWLGSLTGDCCRSIFSRIDLATGAVTVGPVFAPIGFGMRGVNSADGVYSADGSVLALRSETRLAPVWVDTATLDVGFGPEDPDAVEFTGIAGLADGSIAVSTPTAIVVYDPGTRRPTRTVPLPADLATWRVVALPGGELLTTGFDGLARIGADGSLLWSIRSDSGGVCADVEAVPASGRFVCLPVRFWGGDPYWVGDLRDGRSIGLDFATQSDTIVDTLVLDDGSLVVVNQRTAPFLQRFALDGSGPVSHLVAEGMSATSGFVDDRTIVVTERSADPWNDPAGRQVLWDLDRDTAVGEPARSITPLGDGLALRLDGAARVVQDVSGVVVATLDTGLLGRPGSFRADPAYGDGPAFAITNDFIIPFDPRTGEPTGAALDFGNEFLADGWGMAHQVPGRQLVVVTWWNFSEARHRTDTYDLETGEHLASSPDGGNASIVLPSGSVLTATSSELRRSTLELDAIDALPRASTGGNRFELSEDGSLLLYTGFDRSSVLYDADALLKLGDEIAADSPAWDSAHLSPDGGRLITNDALGVLVWDLDTAGLAHAACRMTGRSLTPTEWRSFFGSEPWVDTCASLPSTPG